MRFFPVAFGLLPKLLFTSLVATAQPQFEKIDAWADTFSQTYSDAADLALRLTKPFSTETDKARAIFSWVAQHVRYDVKKQKPTAPQRFEGLTEAEFQQQKNMWDKERVLQTLRKKRGTAEDYSRLFQALCTAAGIEAVMIEGWGRSFFRPFQKLPKKPNHFWNAVKIGEKWKLVDVTWAAGYTDEDVSKFTPYFQPGLFFTPPERFIQDHLPLDLNWQLSPCLMSPEAFPLQIYVNSSQVTYPIEDYWPKFGTIVPKNGMMEIRIKFTHTPPALVVASRNTRALEFEQKMEAGYVVLRFKKPRRGEIDVYGGEKTGKKGWLLRYNF